MSAWINWQEENNKKYGKTFLMFQRLKAKEAKISERKSVKGIEVKAEDNEKYYVKPWHGDKNYNFCNSSRPIIASAIAEQLAPRNVCPYAIITGIKHEDIDETKEFFGLRHLNGSDFDLSLINDNNNEDLARIFLLDMLLFFNDRKKNNLNLYHSAENVFMIDLDNFFSFDLSKANPKEEWKMLLNTNALLENIRKIKFNYKEFIKNFNKISQTWFNDLFSSIPNEWLEKGGGKNIREIISISQNHSNNLIELLD